MGNVSAEDKKTNNKNQVTITNDSGRLSKDEIEQMVKDAEQYADEDKAHQDRVGAKNALEGYCYSMKSSIEGDLKDKLDGDDKKIIEDKVAEVIAWLDNNGSAEKDEFEEKKKEVEGVCNPIMTKMYGAGGEGGAGGMPGGMPGGFPGAGGDAGEEAAPSGPQVEEVD